MFVEKLIREPQINYRYFSFCMGMCMVYTCVCTYFAFAQVLVGNCVQVQSTHCVFSSIAFYFIYWVFHQSWSQPIWARVARQFHILIADIIHNPRSCPEFMYTWGIRTASLNVVEQALYPLRFVTDHLMKSLNKWNGVILQNIFFSTLYHCINGLFKEI